MTDTTQQLLGLQRAEFQKAAGLQTWLGRIQVFIALGGVAGVFITQPIATYATAIVSLILAVVYAWISVSYRSSRSLAEQVRRATLLAGGLGIQISPAERRDILTRFSVNEDEGRRYEDPNYFASRADLGPRRLTEMLEESAFWSADLYRESAKRSWRWFIGFIVAAVCMLLVLPLISGPGWIDGARVICVMLVLFVSNEALGTTLAYQDAAEATGDVVSRLQRVKADGYRQEDLLLILGDYNAAVEGAPMHPEGLYEERKGRLNELWAQHISV